MKIAYFLTDPGIGIFGVKGASVHAQEMIRAFRTMGHEVTVYCLKRGTKAGDPGTETVPEDLRNLPVFASPVTGAKDAPERELAVLRAASRLATLAADEDYDLIYERYSLFSDAGVQLAQQLRARTGRKVPVVMEVNSPLLDEQRQHRSLHHAQLAQEITREAFAQADLLSCVSEPVAAWTARQSGHHSAAVADAAEPGTQIVVTPNGVNTERFGTSPDTANRADDDEAPGSFTVGFVGTLKPWHGTEQLVEAFASAAAPGRARWRLEIAGDGPQRKQLESLAVELGIRDQVIFHGAVAPSRVPMLLRRFDVATAPYPQTQDHYFSPLKVYEYMAAGLPTIASAIGEIPELLAGPSGAGQDAGLLVRPGDVEALAGALSTLAQDGQLRTAMGVQARRRAVEQHSWIRRAEDLLNAVHTGSGAVEVKV
ncbi:glycosyltransferase family 4 protein [Nesterenkonia massiliensis]|uniref:D-inositol 3-phosphate glycosyltransferase n=1 Tax=Nesterenkonia massiliensis TaxID=1232429 RepID=A0ABT2HM83_9MICC|nr:glycosyltransferase family 4 protein [Nesterenkonia massiliensis]MCT1605791.1 glycosyltransferase family 4 protein [Nesterenkonia massiliensis]